MIDKLILTLFNIFFKTRIQPKD